VRGRIGQRIDDLHLFGDRTGPSVRDDQRQGIFMLGPDVDEVDVQPVDFSDEIRHGVETRLHVSPVIAGPPVAQKLLDGLERDALRVVGDSLLLRQADLRQAPTQVGQGGFWNIDAEGPDRGVLGASDDG
jgi:hypothetical protein